MSSMQIQAKLETNMLQIAEILFLLFQKTPIHSKKKKGKIKKKKTSLKSTSNKE